MRRASITRTRGGVLAAAGLLAVAAFTAASAQPAQALPTRYLAVNATSTPNAVGGEIARCQITTNGGTCTITSGKSATRTIELSIGATRAEIAGSLGISASTTTTTTVGCTSPPLQAGQTWRARAMGTRYVYNVARQEMQRPRFGPSRWVTVQTSTTRSSAFDPAPSRISCG